MKSIVASLAFTLTAGLATVPLFAQAQGGSALEVVEQLNSEAMEAYHNMDIERAGSMLEEALRVAQEGGVTGTPYAQANLNLGVVYIGGLGDQQGGASYFLVAICTDSSVSLDPLTGTPDMQTAFTQAQQQARSGACPAGVGPAPAQTSPMAPEAAAPVGAGAAMDSTAMDNETPWDDREVEKDYGEFRRLYVSMSLTFGLAYIKAGMKADRDPPENLVFQRPIYGPAGDVLGYERVPNPREVQANNRRLDAQLAQTGLSPEEQQMLLDRRVDLVLPEAGDDLRTPWVPDADSEDSWSRATGELAGLGSYRGSCESDGTATGPDPILSDDMGNGLFPSKYCVRVASAGMEMTMALRLGVGYFVTDSIGLGLVGRLQFSAGQGSFASLLFGPRMEVLLTEPKAVGFMAGVFFGGTMGQIQVQPDNPNAGANPPWIISGPFGGHVGANLRYRFHPNFGIVFGPELDVLFPDLLFNVDLPLGVEGAFF